VANHKSAEKRIRQTARRTARNRYVRSTMRTFVKRVRVSAEAGEADAARAALIDAMKKIDGAASKGVIHRKQASRRISRLQLLVNQIGSAD
jgi:small subunit ribosomal protein S20